MEADNVVLATNSPIHHNLAVHSRQEPYRSYVVGLRIPDVRSSLCKAHVIAAASAVGMQRTLCAKHMR